MVTPEPAPCTSNPWCLLSVSADHSLFSEMILQQVSERTAFRKGSAVVAATRSRDLVRVVHLNYFKHMFTVSNASDVFLSCFFSLYERTPIKSVAASITPVCYREAPEALEPFQNDRGGTTTYSPVMHGYTVGKQ